MTPRTKYLHFWYEVSTTSADPNGSKWQGQLRLGKDLADGRQELILDGHLVPGYFDTEARCSGRRRRVRARIYRSALTRSLLWVPFGQRLSGAHKKRVTRRTVFRCA
jgi:hypothetical protein